jgi:hypothetical protein
MPTPTRTPLASITLGSARSSVIFSSLPQNYRDLICVVNMSGNVGGVNSRFQLNGNNVGYNWYRFSGGGNQGSVDSTGATDANEGRVSTVAQTGPISANPMQMVIHIMDYSLIDKHKTVISRADGALREVNTGCAAEFFTTRWANTAAITSFNIFAAGGSFGPGSTFTLYGVIA